MPARCHEPIHCPISPWLTYPGLLVAAIGIGTVLGGLLEQFLLHLVYGRDEALQLFITFAVFIILDNLQRVMWGVQPIFAAAPLQLLPNISVLGVGYTSYHMMAGSKFTFDRPDRRTRRMAMSCDLSSMGRP